MRTKFSDIKDTSHYQLYCTLYWLEWLKTLDAKIPKVGSLRYNLCSLYWQEIHRNYRLYPSNYVQSWSVQLVRQNIPTVILPKKDSVWGLYSFSDCKIDLPNKGRGLFTQTYSDDIYKSGNPTIWLLNEIYGLDWQRWCFLFLHVVLMILIRVQENIHWTVLISLMLMSIAAVWWICHHGWQWFTTSLNSFYNKVYNKGKHFCRAFLL